MIKKKNILQLITVCALVTPFSALAAVADILDAEILVFGIVTRLTMLFWVIIIAFFIWGVIKFIKNSEDSAEHEQGKKFMIWGVIAILVLVSVWAFVRIILVDTLGITPTGVPNYIDKNGTTVI